MGGDEGTILKHKVKAKEENHLTNKKPTLNIMSQCRIPNLWIETKQSRDTILLGRTTLQVYLVFAKIGQSNGCIQMNSRLQTKYVTTITCT